MAGVVAVGRRLIAVPNLGSSTVLLWPFVAAVCLLICFPIAMVILGGFNVATPGEGYRFGLDAWQKAWADPQIRPALGYTISIVGIRMAIGFVVAVLLAWLIARTNLPGARWFELALWLSFFLPTLASVQGWLFLLEGRVGLVNQWIQLLPFVGTSPVDLYSFWGIVWVHLMSHTVSSLFILMVEAFRNMDAGLEDSARVCGTPELGILRLITVPLMRPVIAMAVVLAIIRGLQSFEVERVLGTPVGIPVYATLVVDMIRDQPPRLAQGAALSTLVLVTIVPLIIFQRLFIGSREYTTVTGRMRPAKIDLARFRWPAFSLVALFALLTTVVPFGALLLGTFMKRWGYFGIPEPWTLKHWQAVLDPRGPILPALTNSLALGLLSGLVATIVTFCIAYILVRTHLRGRAILDFVSWLPWAIPGVLLSLGILTMIFDVRPLRVLHGSMVALILAVVLSRFPLGVHLLKSGLLQLGKELEEASQVAGARWWYTQLRINLPILMPMLIAVGLMTFVAAMNEVSGVILLASAETRTLSLLALDLLASQRAEKEAASVVTTIVVLMSVAVTLAARRLSGARA